MESVAANILDDKEALVDPFLVEALQNPRHRLTILRMELDIQRFLQNTDQHQFEFQHFPTSYLRLAAHRVAQHYGLVTMVQDNGIDGFINKIVVKKTGETRYPVVRLSEIPAKQSETGKPEHVKIAVRPRPNKGSEHGSSEFGIKRSPVRTVEERKEEYDRARARIFSSSISLGSDDRTLQAHPEKRSESPSKDDNEGCTDSTADSEKNINIKDGSFRIAIFRDREKDLTDPDYDRNYERYVRSNPINLNFGVAPFNVQKIEPPFVQYDTGYPLLGQMPRPQASLPYRSAANPGFSPFCAVGSNQTTVNPAYVPWPSASMMYAHSYEQFALRVFQAPFCQQPLSIDYSQNHG